MKKMIALAVLSLALVGCSYSMEEVEASKAACYKVGGEFTTGTDRDGVILTSYCTVSGIRYNYDRTTNAFFNAVVVK